MSTLDPSEEQFLRETLQKLSLHEVAKYHPDYREPKLSWVDASAYEFFAAVVDGEVAEVFPVDKEHMARLVAAWSSDPKIVVLKDEQKNVVQSGWTYNYETGDFTQPA